MHHSTANRERLYVSTLREKMAKKGLIQLELTYKTTTLELKKYWDTAISWMLQLVSKKWSWQPYTRVTIKLPFQ